MPGGWTCRPALFVAPAYLAGLALIRHGGSVAAPVPLVVLGIAALIAAAAGRPSARRGLAIGASLATALAAGAFVERARIERCDVAAWRNCGRLARLEGRPVQIVGRVRGVVRDDGADPPGVVVDVQIESLRVRRATLPFRGRCVLAAPLTAGPVLRRCGTVSAWVRLRDPVPPCASWRVERDVLRARATSARLVEGSGTPGPVRALRERLRERLDAALAPGPGRGLARALVLGERDGLEQDVVEGMAAAGTVHVLSVSGLHVAVVAAAAAWMLRLLGLARARAEMGGAAVAWGFTLLSGFEVPSIRAAALYSLVVLARRLGRGTDPWNALAATALVSACVAPRDAFSLSFDLTFCAAAGLVALARPLREVVPARGPVLVHALRDGIALGIAAWIGILPACAFELHRLQPLSPLLNLAAVPLAAVATIASLVAAGLAAASAPLAHPVGLAVELLARALDVADRPAAWADARAVTPSLLAVLAWGAGWLTFALWRDPRLRAAGALLAVAVMAASLARDAPLPPGSIATLELVDVGQGQCAVISIAREGRRPWRAVVDAGGWGGSHFDVGERLAAPALWRAGVRRVDVVAVSHADFDHRGGAPAIVRLFRPSRVVVPPLSPDASAALADVEAAAERVGATFERAAAGSRLSPAGAVAELLVLGPSRAPEERAGLSDNDGCLAIALESGGRILALVPGDLEARGEEALIRRGLPAGTVLVLGHHGSRTSTGRQLLGALRPRVALVSCGRGNRFGHPHAEVLDRLAGVGLEPWSTASDGTIRVTFSDALASVDACGCAGQQLVRIRQ